MIKGTQERRAWQEVQGMLFAVALDVSALAHSQRALEVARHAAAGCKGARLLLVTVVREGNEEARRAAQAALAAHSDEGVVLLGDDPGKTLVAFVDAFAPHVLVVGTTEKTNLEQFVLGSVSQWCLDKAKCNVLVAR